MDVYKSINKMNPYAVKDRAHVLVYMYNPYKLKILVWCHNNTNNIKLNTSKKGSLHLYEGSLFQIWLLYGDIIYTDVCGISSSTF